MEKKNQNLISLLILLIVALMAGAWFLFKDSFVKPDTSADAGKVENVISVEQIKNLAKEDLKFFPPNGDDLFTKVENTDQYKGLTLDLDTSIDLRNSGNPFPFGQISSEVTE